LTPKILQAQKSWTKKSLKLFLNSQTVSQTTLYINGIKSWSKRIKDKLDPSIIERMDVTKTEKESTIKIISKILKEFQMLQFLLMEKNEQKELDKMILI
jgi:hypothetical protein